MLFPSKHFMKLQCVNMSHSLSQQVLHQPRRGFERQQPQTSHCFPWRVLPERAVECCSDQPLPSLELVTHKTHKCRQTGAYRTLNKRGHIPYVFPHEVTSCSRGRLGCWESTGDRLRTTLPLPKGLISSICVFFFSLCLQYLHLSIHPYLPLSFQLSSSFPLEL